MIIDKLLLTILVIWVVHDFVYMPVREWHHRRKQ